MIINNARVIGKTRLPHGVRIGFLHTAETYFYMLEKGAPDDCLVFDVMVQKGDMKPLASEQFVHEFMEKNCPDVEYYLERHIDAFDAMLEKLHGQGEHSAKAFIYYYCYSEDKEAIAKLYRFIRSKPFMAKVEKYLSDAKAGEQLIKNMS